MVLAQNLGARWANHCTKPVCTTRKSVSPAQPNFSLQTRSRYIYSVSSERGILLFKARHSQWVQPHREGATEKSKGFEKIWRLPTSEIHASLPCKEGHPTTAWPPYGKDKLVCRAICSFPLSTGRNVHLQIKKWSRHTKHSSAGLKGPAPVPWERAWPREPLWSAAHSRQGAGREGEYTPRSVFFPLGSVLGVISLPEVGGQSQKGQLGRGLWSSPATSCSSLTFCLPSSWV